MGIATGNVKLGVVNAVYIMAEIDVSPSLRVLQVHAPPPPSFETGFPPKKGQGGSRPPSRLQRLEA